MLGAGSRVQGRGWKLGGQVAGLGAWVERLGFEVGMRCCRDRGYNIRVGIVVRDA